MLLRHTRIVRGARAAGDFLWLTLLYYGYFTLLERARLSACGEQVGSRNEAASRARIASAKASSIAGNGAAARAASRAALRRAGADVGRRGATSWRRGDLGAARPPGTAQLIAQLDSAGLVRRACELAV